MTQPTRNTVNMHVTTCSPSPLYPLSSMTQRPTNTVNMHVTTYNPPFFHDPTNTVNMHVTTLHIQPCIYQPLAQVESAT